MPRRDLQECLEHPLIQRFVPVLRDKLELCPADSLFRIANGDLQLRRKRDISRGVNSFECLLNDFWSHRGIEHYRMRVGPLSEWPLTHFAVLKRTTDALSNDVIPGEHLQSGIDSLTGYTLREAAYAKRVEYDPFEAISLLTNWEESIARDRSGFEQVNKDAPSSAWVNCVAFNNLESVDHELPPRTSDWRLTPPNKSLEKCCAALHAANIYQHFLTHNSDLAKYWQRSSHEEWDQGWLVETKARGESIGLFFATAVRHIDFHVLARKLLVEVPYLDRFLLF